MQHRHLKSEDREVIQKMKDQGYTQKKIAEKLAFSKSTISRELKRYSSGKEYYATTAQKLSDFRRAGANQLRSKKYNRVLLRYILSSIKKEHSPEQISGRLKLLRPGEQSKNISHETIDKVIYGLFKAKKLDSGSFFRRKKVNYRQKRSKRAQSMAEQNKSNCRTLGRRYD